MKIEYKKINEITPYVNNQKIHDEKQIEKIAGSIKEFGFLNPIIIDKDNVIIAGHGRYEASKKLELKKVPVIKAENLTPMQIKAYRIADNRLAELSLWDNELLKIGLKELEENNYDLEGLGFDSIDLDVFYKEHDEIFQNEKEYGEDAKYDADKYTHKIESPTYEIKGTEPELEELVDSTVYDELMVEIEKSKVKKEVKEFLKKAVTRFLTFNYSKIAEYYVHQDKETQELFEKLALVIIDYQKAIENGFIRLSKKMMEGFYEENRNNDVEE